jgi:hypothetical protein
MICLERPRLLDDTEAVRVIAVEDIRTHEGEDRHQVVDDGIASQRCDVSNQEQGLMEGLWVARD